MTRRYQPVRPDLRHLFGERLDAPAACDFPTRLPWLADFKFTCSHSIAVADANTRFIAPIDGEILTQSPGRHP